MIETLLQGFFGVYRDVWFERLVVQNSSLQRFFWRKDFWFDRLVVQNSLLQEFLVQEGF